MKTTLEQAEAIERIRKNFNLSKSDYELTRTKNQGVIMYFEDHPKRRAYIISANGQKRQSNP